MPRRPPARQQRKPPSSLRKTPRQARARSTVAAIVEAAARILAEGGPRAVTTNRVAARAGVSVGSLYQYFPNRSAVLRALIERELATAQRARPAAIDDAALPLASRVGAIVDWHLAVHAANPALSRGLDRLVAEALPREERARYAAERHAKVRETIRSLLAPGSRRDVGIVALVVDSCLAAATAAFVSRRAQALAEPALADELALLLTRYLEP
jgi:AcrR family transcriptional regulator